MAARSIGTGTISFGLVTIPVKLFSSSEASAAGVSFNMLHAACNSRLKQQYICTKENVVVDRKDTVKGYEFQKDSYVVFTEQEIKALEEQASKAIEITEFIPLKAIDPVYFEKAYYLAPDKGAEKAYILLAEAMRTTGRSALAKYAARGKQYLVLLRPLGKKLVMQELKYKDEVKDFDEIPVGNAELKDAELKLAVQLIDQIASESFHPEKYKDEVRGRILAQIEKKVAGQEVSLAPTEEPKGKIIDLMEALKASLAGPAPAAAEPAADEERKPPKRAPKKADGEKKSKKA